MKEVYLALDAHARNCVLGAMTAGGERVIENGAIVTKGLANMDGYIKIATAELIGCGVGQIFGFITVLWRGAYEAKVSGGAAADKPAEETAAAAATPEG
jgi:hypothetical protein